MLSRVLPTENILSLLTTQRYGRHVILSAFDCEEGVPGALARPPPFFARTIIILPCSFVKMSCVFHPRGILPQFDFQQQRCHPHRLRVWNRAAIIMPLVRSADHFVPTTLAPTVLPRLKAGMLETLPEKYSPCKQQCKEQAAVWNRRRFASGCSPFPEGSRPGFRCCSPGCEECAWFANSEG